MRPVRLLLVLAVVAALFGLTVWWPGDSDGGADSIDVAAVPASGNSDDLSSTWFCAASSVATGAPSHFIILTNPASDPVQARLTAYNAEGVVGEREVEVPPSAPLTVNVGQTFGASELSLMVESRSGGLLAEHRLIGATGADQVPCATSASEQWYFPAQTTVTGTTARLVLFNPFSADAGVDITAALSDGVRIPGEWTGIVVPAGTTKIIDLGEQIQIRDLFSLSVRLRIGRVIAETTQTFDDSEINPDKFPSSSGLRLQLGVPSAASDWTFAEGFTGEGVREQLVVFNPGEDKATVAIQVTPFGGAQEPPEPFELEVAPRRYGVIDLSAETRIPGQGFHAIRVQTDADTPVAVGRLNFITTMPPKPSSPEVLSRPNVPWGAAIGTASTIAAAEWIVPQVIIGAGQSPMVAVHNPTDGIVVVSASIMGGASDGALLADGVEVPAGDSIALPLSALEIPDGEVGVRVEAGSPVVVERTVTFRYQKDLSMGLAIPIPTDDGRFQTLAEG